MDPWQREKENSIFGDVTLTRDDGGDSGAHARNRSCTSFLGDYMHYIMINAGRETLMDYVACTS